MIGKEFDITLCLIQKRWLRERLFDILAQGLWFFEKCL